MDRIDMHVQVPAVPYSDLSAAANCESSEMVRQRVVAARKRQNLRLGRAGIYCNAQMSGRQVRDNCRLNQKCTTLLHRAADRFKMSARAYFRTLKIARTIADLDKEMEIRTHHLTEAIQYRSPDERSHDLTQPQVLSPPRSDNPLANQHGRFTSGCSGQI